MLQCMQLIIVDENTWRLGDLLWTVSLWLNLYRLIVSLLLKHLMYNALRQKYIPKNQVRWTQLIR